MSPCGAGKSGCPNLGAAQGGGPAPLRVPELLPPAFRRFPVTAPLLPDLGAGPRSSQWQLALLSPEPTLSTSDQSTLPPVLRDSSSIQWRDEVREAGWGAGITPSPWQGVEPGAARGLAGVSRPHLSGRGERCNSQWEARGGARRSRVAAGAGSEGPGRAGGRGESRDGPGDPGGVWRVRGVPGPRTRGAGAEQLHPGLGGGRGEGAGPGLPSAVTAPCRWPSPWAGTAAVNCPGGAVLGLLHFPFPSPFREIRDLVASRS